MSCLSRLHAVAFVLFATALGAEAQDLVQADNPAKILEIARGFGSAELESEADGTPIIRGRLEGARYSIFFFGCENGKDCGSIQFWTYAAAPENALEVINAWNRDFRFGKAYLDKTGDVTIEMDVNLWGGVSVKNLDDTFDWWRSVIRRMNDDFGGLTPSPGPDAPDARGTTL